MFRWIVTCLKNKFTRKQEKEEIQTIVKSKIQQVEYTENQKDLFDKAKIGDVIYAKMPLSSKALEKIEKSHRQRPYVIVKRKENSLLAYQVTGKPYYKLKSYEYYYFKKSAYSIKKDCYIILDKVYELPIHYLLSYYTHLYDKTIRELERRLLISSNKKRYKPLFKVNTSIEIGDIFLVGKQLYLVYQKDASKLYVHKVHKNCSKDNMKLIMIEINEIEYFISYLSHYSFNSNVKYPVINLFTKDVLEYFYKEKNRMKKKIKKNTDLAFCKYKTMYPVGKVFSIVANEKYIYLYHVGVKMYGISYEEKDSNSPILRRIKNEEYLNDDGQLSYYEMKKIIGNLINVNHNPHDVLTQIAEEI